MADETLDSTEDLQVVNEELLREGIQFDASEVHQEKRRQNVNFEDVYGLTLSYQKLVSIQHLHDFHSLTKLQLDNNQITRIENLDSLINLEWLDLSFNRIEKIEGLQSLTKLTDLSLFNNHLPSIEGLDSLMNLQILSIGNNKITNIENVDLLRKHPHLRVLKLSGNPICKLESYKPYVLSRLSDLESLDYRRVISEEISEAKEQYQDDLLEISEKEGSICEAVKAAQDQETHLAKLAEANLAGVETLIDSMESDAEWNRLCSIPGISEAWNEVRNKLNAGVEEFKTAMFDQLEKRRKEREAWQRSSDSYLECQTESCKAFIRAFEKQKKRLLARISSADNFEIDISSSLKSKLLVLKNTLFSIEEEVVEVLRQFNHEYEAVQDALSTKSKTLFATFFTQIRDLLNGLSSKTSSIALGAFEKYARESDLEKVPAEVKVYFNDKEILMTALQNSHDFKISKVDLLEEELLHKETFLVQQNSLERNLQMKKRHCDRIGEILSYLELNGMEAESIDKTNIPVIF